MIRQFAAVCLSAIIALTSFGVAPAAAHGSSNRDVAKIIAGAAALVIIGSALANDRGSSKRTKYQRRHRAPAKVIPAGCLRSYATRDGRQRWVSRYCAQKETRAAHRLPSNCARTLRTRHGRANVYSPRCLRRSGWSIGGSRR